MHEAERIDEKKLTTTPLLDIVPGIEQSLALLLPAKSMASRSCIRLLIRATKPRFQSAPIRRTFSDTIRHAESPSQTTNHERTTHFGFETVAEAEKEARGSTTPCTIPRARS